MTQVLLAGFALALAATAAVGAGRPASPTVDVCSGPLRLAVDGASGRVTGVAVGRADLTARQAVALSGFSLADGPKAEFAPLPCRVGRAAGGAWQWDARTDTLRLTCTARPAGRGIEFTGQVADPRGANGSDHAVTLRFALPVALPGGRMDRDLERSLPLLPEMVRSTAIPGPWGRQSLELWPAVAIAGEKATLGFGSRIDEPQLFRVAYDGPRRLFRFEVDFALASAARKWPRTAPFRFLLMARADGWGLRGCLEDYYAAYPELFRPRTDLAGGWFAWGDILSIAAPAADFGLAYHEGPESARARLHSLALGAKTFPYIEPLMYQLPLGDLDHPPTRPEIEERLAAWSQPLDPLPKAHRGYYDHTRCAATVNSGIRAPDGGLDIAAIGQYPWIDGSRWAAQLALNLDPKIPGGAGELFLKEERDNMKQADWGEGRYLDSFSAHTHRSDYAPEHFAVSGYPPTWIADEQAPGGFRACQPVAVSAFEYTRDLRSLLDQHGKLILVNQYGHDAPCPFHVFDCLGKEFWVPGAGRLLQRYRAVSYHKVVSDLPGDSPVTDQQLREFLMLGVFPGGYGRGDWGQEQMRATYRRIMPLLRLEHRLGWEPVPHARAAGPGVLVERFGGGMGKPLCLAVLNRFAPKVISASLDARALGLPETAWCREMLDDGPVSWKMAAGRLGVQLGMGAGETKLLAIGGQAQHAAIARILAEDHVGQARLCASEHEAREGKPHPLKARLASATAASATALKALAGSIPRGSVLDQRIGELLGAAAAWAAEARSPAPRKPRPVTAPAPEQSAAAALPWVEDFSKGLSPERWEIPAKPKSRIEVRDGRLEMELSPQETSVGISTRRAFNFGAQPLEFRWRFQFNHAGHQWYLMQSVRLAPPNSAGDEYLHFRVDPGIQVRLENGDTPPSNYQYSLTPYQSFATNVPHQVRLVLTGEQFHLEMDGKMLGEGAHNCGFTEAALTLGAYTGHAGHGDVVWWDDLEVRPTRWPVGK